MTVQLRLTKCAQNTADDGKLSISLIQHVCALRRSPFAQCIPTIPGGAQEKPFTFGGCYETLIHTNKLFSVELEWCC